MEGPEVDVLLGNCESREGNTSLRDIRFGAGASMGTCR